MARKVKITIKKLGKGVWGIYKNGRKISEEVSKDKALGAAEFYREYYKLGRKKWEEKLRRKIEERNPAYRINKKLSDIFGF